MKKIFNLFLMMAIATTISLTSCKTEGCTDPTATNYDEKADTDDGTCTFERDAFLGTYNNCVDNCVAGDSFSMTVSAASENTSTISISNFAGFGSAYSIKATVSGSSLTLMSGSLGTGITLLSGSGSLNGNILTILYTYEDEFGTESCSITATI